MQQAAADGFAVTRLVTRPQPNVNSTSDIVFIGEKTAVSRPLRYDLVLAGNGPSLEKDINKSTAKGFGAQATWASLEWMTVLLSKPFDAPCDRSQRGPSRGEERVQGLPIPSSTDGALLGIHRVKDGFMTLYDGKDRSLEYASEEGALIDADTHPPQLPREHRQLVDKLNGDGGRGYRPFDVAWRDAGTEGSRAVDVILARKRD